MKTFNLLFAIVVIFAITTFQSCSDPCKGLTLPSADCICTDGVITCTTDPCDGVTCPDGYSCLDGVCTLDGFETVQKAGAITADETWSADKIYVLNGKVVVEDGVTLTIEAGTLVKGAEGTGSLASALIVARGAKLMAQGTADNPIIFTSVQDNIQPGEVAGSNLDETDSGLWGGLIILGKAPISVEDNSGEAQIEGIPADDSFGAYGGTDANDNSGTITYISVRHGGALIGDGNEINGITLGGVGAGTTIENIEVVGNLDDGIEWFGGTVNVTNALVWAADDDALDIDQAYSGTINNAVVIAFGGTDHGLEIDGPEGTATGAFTLTNVTVKGADDELGNMRDGATGSLVNIYFFGFTEDPTVDTDPNEAGIQAEGDFTFSNADGSTNTDDAYANGLLTFTGFEITTNFNVADIFPDFNTTDQAAVATVAAGANTKGADTSVFGWTFASSTGALSF